MTIILPEDIAAVRSRLKATKGKVGYKRAEIIIKDLMLRLTQNNERLGAIIQILKEEQEQVLRSYKEGGITQQQACTHLHWKLVFLVTLFESAESRRIISEQGEGECSPIADLNAMVDEARSDMFRARYKKTPQRK